MSFQNQILPFATGGGADVLSPADYAAASFRTAGFVAGIADAASCNTAWRQASFVAATVAQFVADYGIADVLDDGNIVNFEANLVAALQKFYPPASSLLHYGDGAGTANALTATVSPPITTLVKGTTLLIKASQTNTGAATINPNAIGVTTITRADGSALGPGDIETGEIAILIFDGTNFQLASSMFLANDLVHYGPDTSGVANTVTVPVLDPPLLSLKAGISIKVKIANSNTGSVTLNAGGLGAHPVKGPTGSSLVGGEFAVGAMATFDFDGNQFYLQTAQAIAASTSSGGITSVLTQNPIHGSGVGGDPVAVYDGSITQKGVWARCNSTQLANGDSTTCVTPADLQGLNHTSPVIQTIIQQVQANGAGIWQTFEYDFAANPAAFFSVDLTQFGLINVRHANMPSVYFAMAAAAGAINATMMGNGALSTSGVNSGYSASGGINTQPVQGLGASPFFGGFLRRSPGTNVWTTNEVFQFSAIADATYGTVTNVMSGIGASIGGGQILNIGQYGGAIIRTGKVVIEALPMPAGGF